MTGPGPALLDLFLPVALRTDGGGPGGAGSIEWVAAGGLVFDQPFYDDVVRAAAAAAEPVSLLSTTLDALESVPVTAPSVIICHLGRCGSTLFTRLLAEPGRLRCLNEPGPLNELLLAAAMPRRQWLAPLVASLVRGGGRPGEATALKLSSWNLVWIEDLAAAFPSSPFVLVTRQPAEIAASMRARPPAWMATTTGPLGAPGVPGWTGDIGSWIDRLQDRAGTFAWDHVVDYDDLTEGANRLRRELGLEPIDSPTEERIRSRHARRPWEAWEALR